MADARPAALPPSQLGLLLRVKMRSLWNRAKQAAVDAPIRLSAAVVLIAMIWLGLYGLFSAVFYQFKQTRLEAAVAIPLVFNFFFVALLAMLTFSNAIISYGALFAKNESSYLLAAPLTRLDVVTLRFLESLVMASWSLIVLGLPLMFALADMAGELTGLQHPGVFYALFIAFFLGFIPIPASAGLLVAWAAARYFPRRAVRAATIAGGVLLAAFVLWGMRSLRLGSFEPEAWLWNFLTRMSFIQSAYLPNNWVASGIDHALNNQWPVALLYLGTTLANALFASWLTVMIVARAFDKAHDRAAAGRSRGRRPAVRASGGIAGMFFFYLPLPLRLIAAKDLRTFLRDPLQWGQLVILFGLMVMYLTNMPTLRLELSVSSWTLIIPFLNLCAVSLILATFTCRFVFPLVSLEGQKLWLIGLLPMRRVHVLLAKFAFAMTVTVAVALTAMGVAAFMLELKPAWTAVHLGVTIAICFGLCGFSVGIGARLPMFHQTNVARIANGLGGTTNLLASVALVAVVLTGVGQATYRSQRLTGGDAPDLISLAYCVGSAVLSITAGAVALWIGARHFNRIET